MSKRPRYTVRQQFSGYTSSVSYFVYDTVRKGRVTVHAHRVREGAQADADSLNATEAQHQANLADPAWVAEHDAKLAAQGLAINAAGDLIRLEDAP